MNLELFSNKTIFNSNVYFLEHPFCQDMCQKAYKIN